jgi:2-phospho-L-lactate/phosphoenolpyruvate guanylyltransferase
MTSSSYVVLLPVKPPARAKSRLEVEPDRRRNLARAFALDTARACLMTPGVEAVLAITDDAFFAEELRAVGCSTIPDGVADDLNGTLEQAAAEARRRWPNAVPLALCADLPALSSADLVIALAWESGTRFVADHEGVGTTLYTASYDAFDPRFGPGSALAHDATGARAITAPLPRLRRDVDDLDDLHDALVLGVGPRTAERAASL